MEQKTFQWLWESLKISPKVYNPFWVEWVVIFKSQRIFIFFSFHQENKTTQKIFFIYTNSLNSLFFVYQDDRISYTVLVHTVLAVDTEMWVHMCSTSFHPFLLSKLLRKSPGDWAVLTLQGILKYLYQQTCSTDPLCCKIAASICLFCTDSVCLKLAVNYNLRNKVKSHENSFLNFLKKNWRKTKEKTLTTWILRDQQCKSHSLKFLIHKVLSWLQQTLPWHEIHLLNPISLSLVPA